MIDLALFGGRLVLVVILFLFLFAVMRTGVGLVHGQRKDAAIWSVDVEKGERRLRGLHVDMLGPVVIGRSPPRTSSSTSPTSPPRMPASPCRAPRWCSRTSDPPTEPSSTATRSPSP